MLFALLGWNLCQSLKPLLTQLGLTHSKQPQNFASRKLQSVSGICQAKSKENLSEYSWMLEVISGVHRREYEDELSFNIYLFLSKTNLASVLLLKFKFLEVSLLVTN